MWHSLEFAWLRSSAEPENRALSSRTALFIVGCIRTSVPGVCPDLPCCLDAVEERQRIVEDGDIGLGLSVARTIIETYDGKIWAENHAEGGALFRFTLPLPKPQ